MSKLHSNHSVSWDKREKEQPEHEIDFKGDHIHDMVNNHCKLCGLTREEIIHDY